MEGRTSCRNIPAAVFLCSCVILLLSGTSVKGYKNYTVGESLGWYDTLENPNVNYDKWTAGKTFSLGDFLVFNTDNNHSVIQTYNFTTYKLCDSYDAQTEDTIEWSSANPSSTAPHPVSVAVPLLKQGITYFFSGDYDGEQCYHGQHFKINVTHGQGLPEALKDPSTESPAPTSPADEDSTPNQDTIVSSNFNNPNKSNNDEQDDDVVKKTSASLPLPKVFRNLHGAIGLLGIFWIFY